MYSGNLVFAQVMDLLPLKAFWRCIRQYPERRPCRTFTCLDQFLCMAFAQLTCRESLRDMVDMVETGLARGALRRSYNANQAISPAIRATPRIANPQRRRSWWANRRSTMTSSRASPSRIVWLVMLCRA